VTLGVEGSDYLFEVIEGLDEGEEIVVSGQFMLDSESRLKEAIAKMLEARSAGSGDDLDDLDMEGLTMEADDLDMEGLSMDDDMDMRDLTMDDEEAPAANPSKESTP
jgi:hypothetical protein